MSKAIHVKLCDVETARAKTDPVLRGARQVIPRPAPTVVQLIVYGPGAPVIVEGTATTTTTGTLELELPLVTAPSKGTTVQVVLYGPGAPTVIEGKTTSPKVDGSFDIIPLK